mmetsp:Transcript_1012/g.2208  ORF Transcript_1012/g.2208 Transcript_1012/m.2208 type:complete len:253 (-) Transcript_1012:1188-1946(-)
MLVRCCEVRDLLSKALLLLRLHLRLLHPSCFLDLAEFHVFVIDVLIRLLLCTSLCFHRCKVCRDFLEHSDDAVGLGHGVRGPCVRRVPSRWTIRQGHALLQQLPGLLYNHTTVLVECLDHSNGFGEGRLGILCVLERLLVFGPACLTHFRRFLHVGSDLCCHLISLLDVRSQSLHGGLCVLKLDLQFRHLFGLVGDGGLRLIELQVTPVFVVVLVLLLFHQMEDHLLDHVVDGVKGPGEVRSYLLRKPLQCP